MNPLIDLPSSCVESTNPVRSLKLSSDESVQYSDGGDHLVTEGTVNNLKPLHKA